MIPRSFLLPIFLFAIVFVGHAKTRVVTSFDSMWTVYGASSLLVEGDLDLDEFQMQVTKKRSFGVRRKGGRLFTYFPIGTTLFAVPFVWAFDKAPFFWARILPGFDRVWSLPESDVSAIKVRHDIERTAASFAVALAAVLLFLTLTFRIPAIWAATLTLVFAFATPALSTASRALWPHGPTLLMLSAALFLIVSGEQKPWRVSLAGIPLAFAFIVRPTNAVSIAVLSGLIFWKYRSRFPMFVVFGVLTATPFFLYNLAIYNAALPDYFAPSRITGGAHSIVEVIGANLISPSRGLFVYSPVFLLSLFSLIHLRAGMRDRELVLSLWVIILLHLFVHSSFPNWWGGHAYGPRYMADMSLFFSFLLYPFLDQTFHANRRQKWFLIFAMVTLLVPSFLINRLGAMRRSVLSWNVIPVNIDTRPERVWDWSDPQFLRLSNYYKNQD